MKQELNEIRAFIRSVRSSHNIRRKLLEQQKFVETMPFNEIEADNATIEEDDEGISYTKGSLMLLLDCTTRWGSTFIMIQRYLKLFPVLASLEGSQDWIPMPQIEREFLIAIRSILETIYLISKWAQSSYYPSAGYIPIWANTILDHFDSLLGMVRNPKLRTFIIELRMDSKNKLETYLITPCLPLQIASLIPCFGGLPGYRIPQEVREEVWCALKNTIFEILTQEIQQTTCHQLSPTTSSSTSDDESSCFYDSFEPSAITRQILSSSADTKAHLENLVASEADVLRGYWKTNFTKGKCFMEDSWKIVDPILFWTTDNVVKNLNTIFPAVRVLLSIPGSSARIESAFSHAGIVKSKLSNRMSAERLEQILFVRLNISKLYPEENDFVDEVCKKYSPKIPFSS